MKTQMIIHSGEPSATIEAAVKKRLKSSNYYAIRHVSCELRENVLTLRGKVPSYYQKQLAQNLVRQQLSDGLVLKNRLEVAKSK